ncbi:hypothetical protein BKA59DRAFT_439225 [Fusarium tricinctum]|uniref:DUF6603 domain-containing protein n=1 Tax=Fusarium tricinctum TaxID=61284 RepID=A0A8K0RVG6_9HYPO|nr:hypothetical protein BKA59DRAFT_439225 [Fusarium tricinctum]
MEPELPRVPATGLRVESFHLNVGAGDGAIHLLTCDKLAQYAPDERRVVLQAYIIDGGRKSLTCTNLISQLIRRIEGWYKSPYTQNGHNYLKFDGFMVTHWDNDHFGGLEKWLAIQIAPHTFGNGTTRDIISRARYDVDNGNPLSWMYSPWKWPKESQFSVDEDHGIGYLRQGNRLNLAKVRATHEILLGRNIFRQIAEPIDPKYSFQNVRNLGVLLNTVNPVQEPDTPNDLRLEVDGTTVAMPAMYCIAAEGKKLGRNVAALHTDKNMSSLVFIVVWKHLDGSHHISHYFAGDAHIELEQALAGWLDGDYIPKDKPSAYPITTTKLSHHGAHSSNPRGSFTQFQAKNILVSAGGQYSHPTWQVVLAIYFWFHLKQETSDIPYRKPFIPCRWPYWLLASRSGKNVLSKIEKADMARETKNLSGLGLKDETHKMFKDVNGTRKKLNKATIKNVFSHCWDGDDVNIDELLNTFCTVMGQISVTSTAAPGSLTVGLNGPNRVRVLDMLGYQVTSAPTSDQDGVVNVVVIDMHPYKGVDQPRMFDLTDGPPDWDKIQKLKGLYGNASTTDLDIMDLSKSSEQEQVDEGWEDLGDSLSISTESRRASWATSVSHTNSDVAFPTADIHTPAQTSQLPTISFQKIPPEVRALAAEVYLTVQDEKDPDSEPKAPVGSTAYVLPEKSSHYGFLNTLHYQGIGLTGEPDSKNSTPVDDEDEVFQWLARYSSWDPEKSPVPDGFALAIRPITEWPVTDWENTKLHFEMTVPFLTKAHLRFSTDQGAKLTFSKVDDTDVAPSKREVTEEALNKFLVNRRSLVLGLESLTTPLKTTLADLATYMRVDMLSSPLLDFLTRELELTLDTNKDFHNAIWFRPSMDYETIMRLQFHADITGFNSWLHTLSPSLKVDTLRVIGRKKASWVWMSPNDKMVFTSSLTFLCQMTISSKLQLEGVFAAAEDSVSLTLTLNRAAIKKSSYSIEDMSGSDGVLQDIMTWLADNFQVANKDGLDEILKNAKNPKGGIMSDNSILPRRIEILLGVGPDGKITGVRGVSIDIEACLTIGRPATAVAAEMPAVFLFTVGWSKDDGFHLQGKLWSVIPDTPFAQYDRALPEFEEYEYLDPISPVDTKNQMRTVDIARLLSDKNGEVSNLPAGIPNEIYLCEISLTKTNVAFSGAIRCSKPLADEPDGNGTPPPPMPPTISLDKVELDASYTWGTTSPSDKGFQMNLAISIDLYLGGELTEDKALEDQYAESTKLFGQVTYNGGDWAIKAAAYELSIDHLLQFWDLDDRGPISDFLEKIKIDSIELNYEFKNGKTDTGAPIDDGKDFTIADVVSLTFDYINKGGEGWALTADLGPSKTHEKATVGGLLSGFLDTVVVNSLPDGIRDAAIQNAEGAKALRLLVAKSQGVTVFALLVQIEKVSVWFIQLRQGPKGVVKRIIKAAVSKISVDVSAFQTTINSPWEELFFMWVQDKTVPKQGVDALTGITQKEFEAMSEVMKERLNVTDGQLLLFKPTASKDPAPNAQPNKVVMAAGSHLVIVAKKDGKPGVILDYLFGAKKKPASGKSMVPYDVPVVKGKGPDASGSEKGVKAPYKVKIGPLSVGNVGLWFKDGMIGVTLDATLLMGPLGLSLLGFSIGVPFGGKYSLANPPPPSAIDWGLAGLILSMDKPPLTIAGGFMRDTSMENVEVMYTGGLIVGFKPWSFEAMGAYATVYKTQAASDALGNEVAKKDGEKRPTFTFSFIYVKMNGPLFSVGFADVAGLVGGFGINSDITLPTVEQVISFPFVAERDSAEELTPVQRMQDLMQGSWFRPAEGLYWAAAGARVTAFQMFAANIVLVLQFGNGNLLFGIFGVATCDVPALEAPVKFAHVELGIVCTFDVNSGIFKFEAQLSPRSFVLAPQCHLTGGMALFSWTKGDRSDPDPKNQISAGDWVLTIGGYHRAFFPPKQYPKPPRLGISWSLSSCLSVKGEAYFAITPKVCMGGGKIRAALSIGLLYAWFDAFMDFLMNFDPFYFQMTARVSVGVRFTLDLWLVTIRISVEISAGLDLMGPPFGGVVHVDFWVFGFDIKFGASPKPPPAINLDRFFQVATKTGSSSASSSRLLEGDSNGARSQGKSQPDTAAILLTCETGLLPPFQGDGPDDDKWYVKGGSFTLNASFQIPVTAARLTERRMKVVGDGKQEETRYADCIIEDKYKKVYAKPMQLHEPLTSTVAISEWKLTAQVQPVQSSIWGQYDRNQDPSQVKGLIDGLLDGKDATMQLVTGISIVPPNPAVAGDLVNKFNVTKDHMASVFNPKKPDWPLFIGVTKEQEKAWTPKDRGTDWDVLTGEWKKVGDTTTSKAVDLWAKRMRYDEKSVEEDQKDEKLKGTFSPLRGIAPKKLLNNFTQLVPALPLVAVGF